MTLLNLRIINSTARGFGMRELIINLLKRFGYRISRIDRLDLSAYSRYSEEARKNRRFYNVGAGSFQHPYWTNIDYASEHYSVVQKDFIDYDLMKLGQMPVDGESAEIVYSSQTIEHVSDAAVQNLLNEAYRILKFGGTLRLTTPDIMLTYAAYELNDRTYFYWADWYSKKGTYENKFNMPQNKASIHQLFLHHFAGQLSEIDIRDDVRKYSDQEIMEIFGSMDLENALNHFTSKCKFNPNHPENHINWWSWDKLKNMIARAGFDKIYRSGYGQSRCAVLRDINYFDNTHPKISLYVEAVK